VAEVVATLPGSRRGTKYPWSDWTNGQVWLAKEGKDFTCGVSGFRSALCIAAGRRGLKVSARVRPEGVYFQFRNGE
jgi:hypothetical protein